MNDTGKRPVRRALAQLADRAREDHLLGVRFALNVFVATIIAGTTIVLVMKSNPVWAVASMVAASDPVVPQAFKMFRSRLINTCVGCAVGLGFLSLGEPTLWLLPGALALTVLLSSYVVRVQTMWRQAPITAAIVIAGSVTSHSKLGGMEHGVERVGEVIFGCLTGVAVSWAFARLWPMKSDA